MNKNIIFFPLFVIVFAIVGDFCQKQTKGFRLQNILSLNATGPIEEETSAYLETKKILSQPFYFLKKGQQCFVFQSKDKKYVLKFLRADKLKIPVWKEYLPSYLTNSSRLERQKKWDFDFNSYRIAEKELYEETGLVHIQLGQSTPITHTLELYDNIHVRYFLPLETKAFILQRKTKDFYPYLQEQIAKGNIPILYPFFSSLAKQLQERKQKGISDSDISLEYNMGICNEDPVLFDIGNLIRQENIDLYQEARLILASLQALSPDLAIFFTEELFGSAQSRK